MHVCGQTLVLIDNDASVSEVNQKLVKATVRYMFYHIPEDRAFSINTYDHDITGEERFLTDASDLVCEADKIEYAPKDSNLSDTLCEVISRWKESDFACRDIVVFTDGIEGGALDHEKEELYYLLERCEYPVYVVMLDQENNAEARKGLSAVAVTSGGKFYETEFPGSEAEVDKQLSEMIFSAMEEYSHVHWAKYEEADGMPEEIEEAEGTLEEGVGTEVAGEEAQSVEVSENTEEEYGAGADLEGKVIYEYDRSAGPFMGTGALILSLSLIAAGLLFGIFGGFIMMKKRRRSIPIAPRVNDDDDELFEDFELKGMKTTEFMSDRGTDTVFLSDDLYGAENPTRLLDESGMLVTLTDKEDPGRCYRIVLAASSMTVGRSNCDVMITGDDALSKRHCELYEENGEVCVRDLSSSNGTRVNGVKITAKVLSDKDELTIGSRTYSVGIL